MTLRPAPDAIAVLDIGSNSGRVVAYRLDAARRLRILATTRAALRLVNDVDERNVLGESTVERLMDALRDFRAVARGAGATRIAAVATAAMRDAENGPALVARVRDELGIEVEVIDGEREAAYGFDGAVRGLAVDGGVLFDMGGGSMQLTRFASRRALRSVSLPLGSLRLSHTFLRHDPPPAEEVRALRRHVREMLREAGLEPLASGEALVGTGGTVRNLAKVDRRGRPYPIERLHGYALSRRGLLEITGALAHESRKRRDRLPGLSRDRSDSVVGGALGIETLVELLGASEIVVSGQGVREGLAWSTFGVPMTSSAETRAASLTSLVSRYAEFDAPSARRRSALAARLLSAIDPAAPSEIVAALADGAFLLDVGRAVDFFDRHAHTADVVRAADLDGFTHRELALRAAVVRAGADEAAPADAFKPLLGRMDRPQVDRAGVVLTLADDIEERTPGDDPIEARIETGNGTVRIGVPGLAGWRPRGLGDRFAQVFGKALEVRAS